MPPYCYICKLLSQNCYSRRTQQLCKQAVLHQGILLCLKKLKLLGWKSSVRVLQSWLPPIHQHGDSWLSLRPCLCSPCPAAAGIVGSGQVPGSVQGPPAIPHLLNGRQGKSGSQVGLTHQLPGKGLLVSFGLVFLCTFLPYQDSFPK